MQLRSSSPQFLFLLCHLVCLAKAAAATTMHFEDWMVLHDQFYESVEELEYRRLIYLENQPLVEQHNAAYSQGLTKYVMTMASPFAAMTAEEFTSHYLMESQNCSATHTSSGKLYDPSIPLPQEVDWRTRGVVTPVKNQKKCGSCWAFSTTGTLEAHTCLHGLQPEGQDCSKWTGLSEQQLLDCAKDYDNHGCNGGLPSHAFEYIKHTGGLALEDSYEYRADSDGACQAEAIPDHGAQVAQVYNITAYDEEDLVAAIASVGPVSIAYQVSPDFRFYSHGVYDSYNATTKQTMCKSGPMDVNHAVVAVGLGSTEATDEKPSIPYYIVRNSWSKSWGMEGYFWMERGINLCGVSDCASFPIVPNKAQKHQRSPKLRASLEKASFDQVIA